MAEATPSWPPVTKRLGFRAPFLLVGGLALLAGLLGGLWRLGWTMPYGSSLAALHGPLLISGLFGTLISLERAVALDRGWSYLAPALSALGALLMIGGAPVLAGAAVFSLAAAALVAGSLHITLRQPALFTGMLLLGAVAWLAGNALWLIGFAPSEVAGWWLAFLILTIAGERLELSRLMPPKPGAEPWFLFAAGLLIVGAQNGLATKNGAVLFGLGLLVATAWLLRHDLVRRTVRLPGQPRFMAVAMLSGYLWLGAAGLILVLRPDGAFSHDAALHAILIGFVLSMVFGHSLIILPALAGIRATYRPVLYGPLALLHASLLLRVAGGLLEWQAARLWSGPATVLAVAGFGAAIATSRARRGSGASAAP